MQQSSRSANLKELKELIYFQFRHNCFHWHKKTQSCLNYSGVLEQLGNRPPDTVKRTGKIEIYELHSFRMDRCFVILYITASYSLRKASVSKTVSSVKDSLYFGEEPMTNQTSITL